MLPNLPEGYLSSLLPPKVVAMDERGLLQAFVAGYQDRVEDLRAYVKKFLSLLDPDGLGTEEVVLASVRSAQGLIFLRNLDVDATTPVNPADLPDWVAQALVVEPQDVVSATRGSVWEVRMFAGFSRCRHRPQQPSLPLAVQPPFQVA